MLVNQTFVEVDTVTLELEDCLPLLHVIPVVNATPATRIEHFARLAAAYGRQHTSVNAFEDRYKVVSQCKRIFLAMKEVLQYLFHHSRDNHLSVLVLQSRALVGFAAPSAAVAASAAAARACSVATGSRGWRRRPRV